MFSCVGFMNTGGGAIPADFDPCGGNGGLSERKKTKRGLEKVERFQFNSCVPH